MPKKLSIIFLSACFLAAAMPMQALAAKQPSKDALLKNLVPILQQNLQENSGEGAVSDMSARTQILLEDLLKTNDDRQLKTVVGEYVADMSILQDGAVNLQCALPLSISLISGLSSLAGASSNPCVTLNIIKSIANIIVALQSYQICEIVNSEAPDMAACMLLAQKRYINKVWVYMVGLANTFDCKESVEATDWLSIILGVSSLIPPTEDVCTPTATP
jgi:hypothetical protein